MFSYYLILIIPLVLSLNWDYQKEENQSKRFQWVLFFIFYILVIGYRHEVGGDWFSYLRHFESMKYYNLSQVLDRSDPGYYFINWLFSKINLTVYEVNLFCAGVFIYGLLLFSKEQENPWLAISVSVPYLIMVVAMGYTRQATAIGIVMWSLVALNNKQFIKFLIMVFIAASFHKSAVLMIGLGIFLQGNGRLVRTLAVLTVGYGIWSAFLVEYQEYLWKNYIEIQLESQGAMIRVIMNFIPAIIFFLNRAKWKSRYNDYAFWQFIAIGSFIALLVVSLASTAVDRVSLYFTPLQIVVFSRLPVLIRGNFSPRTITAMILGYYLLVMFVWLNYATHAKYWVPYNNVLFL